GPQLDLVPRGNYLSQLRRSVQAPALEEDAALPQHLGSFRRRLLRRSELPGGDQELPERLGERHGARQPEPASSHQASRRSTTPRPPSTRRSSPSSSVANASRTPTTQGTSSSRATSVRWLSGPPISTTSAPARSKSGT